MPRTSGITIEKPSGNKHYAHIDLVKHPSVRHYLEDIGAIGQDSFDEMAEQCMSLDELRESSLKHVDELYGRD